MKTSYDEELVSLLNLFHHTLKLCGNPLCIK
jgi:hypothetical protein